LAPIKGLFRKCGFQMYLQKWVLRDPFFVSECLAEVNKCQQS